METWKTCFSASFPLESKVIELQSLSRSRTLCFCESAVMGLPTDPWIHLMHQKSSKVLLTVLPIPLSFQGLWKHDLLCGFLLQIYILLLFHYLIFSLNCSQLKIWYLLPILKDLDVKVFGDTNLHQWLPLLLVYLPWSCKMNNRSNFQTFFQISLFGRTKKGTHYLFRNVVVEVITHYTWAECS